VGFFRAGARPATAEIVAFIDAHKAEYGVEPICAVLSEAGTKIAPSTYYAAKQRERVPSARACREAWLKEQIMRVWKDPKKGNRRYGARKVWHELGREGIEVGRCAVERLMPQLGIAG